MAVVSELIDVGLALKEQGNHQAAIEHFRQLHVTYPDHARIMFELAGSWQAFNVPERALPLYRALLEMPKTQGLPPKELPRLYTQMGAVLRQMGQFAESLEIIEAGLQQFPKYRPLRAYHMFALHSAGFHQNAMIESFKLLLESLAPTKWDIYEEAIIAIVNEIEDRVPPPDTSNLEDWEFDEFWGEEGQNPPSETNEMEVDDPDDSVADVSVEVTVMDEEVIIDEIPDPDETVIVDQTPEIEEDVIADGKIMVDADDKEDESFDIQVKVINKDDKKKKANRSSKKDSQQFGKKPVKIDINTTDEDKPSPPKPTKKSTDEDAPPSPTGKIDIPIDFD